MDYKSSKVKQTLTERYKSNDRKFASLEESRQLRAIQKKQEQKLLRVKSLAKFRDTSSCETPSLKPKVSERATPSSTTKRYTKKELRELGKIRYNEMLQWKEERNKVLEKEKNLRKPTFVLGGFTPDAPKYLAGKLSENTERTTPYKFSQTLRGTSTQKVTPAVPKSTFGTKKALLFRTGVTPLPSMSSSTTKPFRNRSQRTFRPPPELGVSPFPETPGTVPKRPLMRRTNSFAPSNFKFKAPTGVEQFHLKQSSSVLRSVSNLLSKREGKMYNQLNEVNIRVEMNPSMKDNKKSEMDLEAKENDSCSNGDHHSDDNTDMKDKDEDKTELNCNADDKSDVDHNDDDEDCSSNIDNRTEDESEASLGTTSVKEAVDLKLPCSKDQVAPNEDDEELILPDLMALDEKDFAADDDEDHNCVMEYEVPNEDKIDNSVSDGNNATDKISVIQEDNSEEMKIDDIVEDNNISIFKDNEILSPIESAKLIVKGNGSTISKKKTRSQIYTPPMSKLRPRTPCSRSTRRSMLAHCNSDHCQHSTKTPKSNKKLGRKSVAKHQHHEKVELKMDFEDQELNEDNIDVDLKPKEKEELEMDAVDETENKANLFPDLETSDQTRGKILLKNMTPVSSDAKTTPESLDNLSFKRLGQLTASPWITRSRGSSSSRSKKKRKSVFDIIINEGDYASPEKLKSPGGSQGGSPSFNENQNKLFELLKHTDRVAESPEVSVWSPDTSQASPQLSKQLKMDIAELESNPVLQLTPALKGGRRGRRSFKKVSLLLPMEEEELKSTTKYPVTPISRVSRTSKSERVSLLPGLETHKEIAETLNANAGENADLISWESPVVSKRRKSRKSIMTPRISLLPGLNSYPEEEEKEDSAGPAPSVDENADLISWDSPVVCQTPRSAKGKSRKSINLNTPLRRSTRHNPI